MKNSYEKTKNIIGYTCISILAISFIIFVVIVQINKPEKQSYSGSVNSLCERTCESVGWDDAKFSEIRNHNDGIGNSCDSYSCSENRPLDHLVIDPVQDNIFHGYSCKGDCSGHKAGYEWASEKGIISIDDCGGNSQSFIEGCKAYVEDSH